MDEVITLFLVPGSTWGNPAAIDSSGRDWLYWPGGDRLKEQQAALQRRGHALPLKDIGAPRCAVCGGDMMVEEGWQETGTEQIICARHVRVQGLATTPPLPRQLILYP